MAAALAGCASLSPEGDSAFVAELAQPRLAAFSSVSAMLLQSQLTPEAQARVNALLQSPLTDQAAVQIALIHSPAAHAALARLGVSDADRVLASTWATPHFSFGVLREGDTREIERAFSFNLLGLLTLPWQSRVQTQQHEMLRLQTAQELVQLASRTRKAWVNAVAAEQSARYMADALAAAQASAELARRMVKAGNWSQMQQTREQLQLAEVQAQRQRAQHQAVVERETLTRLLGLQASQAAFTLPSRLPELPATLGGQQAEAGLQARALRERLDVRSALARTQQLADATALEPWQTWARGMELGLVHNSTLERGNSGAGSPGGHLTKNGWELSLPLPLAGTDARQARAEALMREAAARLRETQVAASSEVRQAWSATSSAHALARQYRDEVVPLRKSMSEEILQRYNGMLLSVFDVLTDARAQIAVVNAAMLVERDFWLVKTDLDTALSGASPAGMTALQGASTATSKTTNEHGGH
jgi:outer membrane protein, multidrug efflux system